MTPISEKPAVGAWSLFEFPSSLKWLFGVSRDGGSVLSKVVLGTRTCGLEIGRDWGVVVTYLCLHTPGTRLLCRAGVFPGGWLEDTVAGDFRSLP